MNTAPTQKQSVFARITPECKDMAKRSTMLNAVGVFFAIVAVILIIVALVYNYMPAEGDAIAKNRAIVGTMTIIALFAIVITALVGVWQILVNKKLKGCIEGGKET
jgi:uncharacterized membrane protein YcjF (UPF0283 family)